MEYPKTSGGEPQNFTTGFYQLGAQQGWQCPICKRVLSPWTPECPCRGQGPETYTTVSTSDSKYNKTITMHNSEQEVSKDE